ncbi:MAG: hypothetical protein AAFW95_11600 [Cyanobacteria bacterium J06638_6]
MTNKPSDNPTGRAAVDVEAVDDRVADRSLPRTAHPYYWSLLNIIDNGL